MKSSTINQSEMHRDDEDSFGYNSFGKVVGELNGPNSIYDAPTHSQPYDRKRENAGEMSIGNVAAEMSSSFNVKDALNVPQPP
jgi:hypothetical protein